MHIRHDKTVPVCTEPPAASPPCGSRSLVRCG